MPLPQFFGRLVIHPRMNLIKISLPFKETREQFDIASKLFFIFAFFLVEFSLLETPKIRTSEKTEVFQIWKSKFLSDHERL